LLSLSNGTIQLFGGLSRDARELIEGMLQLDPKKRLTCEKALASPFFTSPPRPCEPNELPKMEASHEWTAKKKEQRARMGAAMEYHAGQKRARTGDAGPTGGVAYPSSTGRSGYQR
jgi:cyclin-dependent kinase 12/13